MTGPLFNLDMTKAACADADPETFFPHGPTSKEETVMAKAICHDCAIKPQCLLVALTEGYLGVWGETTENERAELRRSGKYRSLTISPK